MSTPDTENSSNGRNGDFAWMRHAISLAQRASGQTHPNPMVGAVIVKNEQLLAEGWHAQDGGPHAEVAALEQLRGRGLSAKDATLYVTLEPCSTHGRTGACTDAIIRAGVTRVVIGATDPFPGHGGHAVTVLEKAGISVTNGVLASECADLNLIFNHRIASGQPLIAAKVAVTLDGKIATRSHHSRWITGEAARADVMHWRRYFPAIGVGAGTVLADNPSLTARTVPHGTAATTTTDPADANIWCPRRLIFDRSGNTAGCPQANVFTDAFASRTLVITTEGAAAKQLEPLQETGVTIAALPPEAFLPAHFSTALRDLLKNEHLSGLYVEGGSNLLSHLLAARALDYLFSYRAPKLLADTQAINPFSGQRTERMGDAFTLRDVRHATFGDDQLMRGQIVYPQA